MTAIDKAAIIWSIGIVAVAVGIAFYGSSGQDLSIGIQAPEGIVHPGTVETPSYSETSPKTDPFADIAEKVKEQSTVTQPTVTKPTMSGWNRVESVQDPGIGHETHQLAVILPPSDKVYSGTITYDASEPIQLVSLKGPLGPGEDKGQPIWTPDGVTKFELTLVDQKSSKGTWKFEGNALALHTMKTTKFIADYKLDYKESAAPMAETSTPSMEGPMTVEVTIPSGTSVPGCEETNECYIPASVSIMKGDTVVWKNKDTAAHTVTSGSPEDGPDGIFDSSLLMGGGSFEHTFDSSGSYDYFCMVHPWMTGDVQVS